MVFLENPRFAIPEMEVFARLGTAKPDGQTKKAVEKAKLTVLAEMEPKAAYRDFFIENNGSEVTLEGEFTIKSKDIASLFKGCKKATLIACTLGNAFEGKGTEAEQFFIDAVSSAAIEGLMQATAEIVGQNAKSEGYQLTQRFSCGYGDWNIREQKEILRVLEGKKLGISLSGANIMVPRKSVTAIRGWFK